MTILTRSKTQTNRRDKITKLDFNRCYESARIKLSKETKITKSYARALYSPSYEDTKYINNLNNLKALKDILYTKLKKKFNKTNLVLGDEEDYDASYESYPVTNNENENESNESWIHLNKIISLIILIIILVYLLVKYI